MEPVDLLVQADWLYPMSEGLPVIAHGEVAVREGRIIQRARRSRPAIGRRSG